MSENDDQEYQPESEPIEPQEPEQQTWDGVTEPQPHMFDDYDNFVKSLADFKTRQALNEAEAERRKRAAAYRMNPDNPDLDLGVAIEEGIRQGLKPQLTPLQAIEAQVAEQSPDDELLPARQEAIDWIAECRQKEHEAEIRGDVEAVRDWQQRAQWGVQKIKELGKSEAEKYADAVHEDIDEQSIRKALLNPDLAQEKIWQSPKMVHDSAIVVIRSNERSKSGTIRLPAESEPWGDVLDCQPRNMMEVKLSPNQYASWRDSVYGSGISKGDHAELFRKSWSTLRKMGFGEEAVPVIKSKVADPDKTDDPAKMSWKRFVAWREESESKKRNRAVMFPRRGGKK